MGHSDCVNSVAFNNTGTILASGSQDKTIKLWNVESQTEIATLTGHSDYVKSVAFNNTGTILASGSQDNTIKLWNVESQTEIATLKGHSSQLLPQFHSIILELFSQVDQTIETIKLWNVESQTVIATLKGHSSSVTSVSFKNTGTILASGSYDRYNKIMECGISN